MSFSLPSKQFGEVEATNFRFESRADTFTSTNSGESQSSFANHIKYFPLALLSRNFEFEYSPIF